MKKRRCKDIMPFEQVCESTWEDTVLGKKGGGNTERAQKNVLARFHFFLKSPMLEKPISFLRNFVSFRKRFQQTGPTQ
jgi:hypothetical protein